MTPLLGSLDWLRQEVCNLQNKIKELEEELHTEKQANTELQLALGAKDYDLTETRGALLGAEEVITNLEAEVKKLKQDVEDCENYWNP